MVMRKEVVLLVTRKMMMIMMMIATMIGAKGTKGLQTETNGAVEDHHVGIEEERGIEAGVEVKTEVENEADQGRGEEVETGQFAK